MFDVREDCLSGRTKGEQEMKNDINILRNCMDILEESGRTMAAEIGREAVERIASTKKK